MNTYLEFAKCRRGHYTPIRPAKPVIPGDDRKWIETETENDPELFACNECKRIYKLDKDDLEVLSSPLGLEPYNPGAPIRRFDLSLPCDELNCESHIPVIVVLNSDTSGEALQKEMAELRGAGLKCLDGHVQSFPSGWND
jgi:hypothetical protein